MFGEFSPRIPGQANLIGRNILNAPALITPAQIAAVSIATAAQLPKWSASLARVKYGIGNALWLRLGDSTERGYNGVNGTNYLNSKTAYLSRMFNASGLNTHFNSTFGADAATAGVGSDNRVAVTGGFAGVGGNSLGGPMFLSSSTGTITFTVANPVDSFFIYYYQQPTAGSFSYTTTVGGVTSAATTITTTGTASMKPIAVPVIGLGIGSTLTINWVSGQVFICGFWAYDSTRRWLQIDNCGYQGSTTAAWVGTTNAYDPIKAAVARPNIDLISICLGINDWDGLVPINTYIGNLQSLVTQSKAVADVILETPNPSQPGTISGSAPPPTATQQLYASAIIGLAVANNIPVVDNFNNIGSWASLNALGGMSDNLHCTGLGYGKCAQNTFNLVANV